MSGRLVLGLAQRPPVAGAGTLRFEGSGDAGRTDPW